MQALRFGQVYFIDSNHPRFKPELTKIDLTQTSVGEHITLYPNYPIELEHALTELTSGDDFVTAAGAFSLRRMEKVEINGEEKDGWAVFTDTNSPNFTELEQALEGKDGPGEERLLIIREQVEEAKKSGHFTAIA